MQMKNVTRRKSNLQNVFYFTVPEEINEHYFLFIYDNIALVK